MATESKKILRSLPESSGSVIEGPELTARTAEVGRMVTKGEIRSQSLALEAWNFYRDMSHSRTELDLWKAEHT